MKIETSESVDMNLHGTGTERLDVGAPTGCLTGIPYPAGDSTILEYSFLLPPAAPDEIGRLGNYRVLSLLGRGGMGFVFLAEDVALNRRTALKVMTPKQAGRTDGWPRFLREARLLAQIKHENIVTVYQAGQEGDVAYIAMELLTGETLSAWQARMTTGRPAEAVRIGRGIATGLAAVHAHGLVHRDIKPANIWLESPSGTVKLLDFGLARGVDDNEFTQNGTILGTPAFMSPEQARGEKLDARSDLFSLGSVMYGICTGTPPFPGTNTLATLTALAMHHVRPAHEVNPEVPRRLSDLIDRLLAKDPDKRPESAEVVTAVLDRIAAGHEDGVTEPKSPARSIHRKKRRKKRPAANRTSWLLYGAIALAAALLIGMGIAVLSSRRPAAADAAANDLSKLVVHLSELTPFEEEDWLRSPPPPPPDRPHPPGEFPPPNGLFELRVAGKHLTHGLFMHPSPHPGGTTARGSFRINRKFSTFQAGVALNDNNGGRTDVPIRFVVRGDGKLLWTSHPIQQSGDRDECRLDVKDISVLTLEVQCPGPAFAAHAVWVDPRLE
jgi:serine/threonine protein kinase